MEDVDRVRHHLEKVFLDQGPIFNSLAVTLL